MHILRHTVIILLFSVSIMSHVHAQKIGGGIGALGAYTYIKQLDTAAPLYGVRLFGGPYTTKTDVYFTIDALFNIKLNQSGSDVYGDYSHLKKIINPRISMQIVIPGTQDFFINPVFGLSACYLQYERVSPSYSYTLKFVGFDFVLGFRIPVGPIVFFIEGYAGVIYWMNKNTSRFLDAQAEDDSLLLATGLAGLAVTF